MVYHTSVGNISFLPKRYNSRHIKIGEKEKVSFNLALEFNKASWYLVSLTTTPTFQFI